MRVESGAESNLTIISLTKLQNMPEAIISVFYEEWKRVEKPNVFLLVSFNIKILISNSCFLSTADSSEDNFC